MCDINSICRICEATEELQNLFVPENDFLIIMLRRVADIEISEDDPLPKRICFHCSTRLGNAYDFKMQCEATDRRFRKEFFSVFSKQLIEATVKKEFEEDHDKIEEMIIEEYLEDEDVIDETEFKIEADNDSIADVLEEIFSDSRFESPAKEDAKKLIEQSNDDPLASSNVQKTSKEDEDDDLIEDLSEKKPKEQSNANETHRDTVSTNQEVNANQENVLKKRFSCNICQKSFAKKYGMIVHMGIHQGLKFTCTQCGRQYSTENNLSRHIRAFHDKIRNFACEICDQRFARGSELAQHANVHLSESPYSCDRCDKKFKSKRYLDMHQNRHDGIYPPSVKNKYRKRFFTCDICGKILSACAYYTHMRCHRGERPFKCSICEMGFTSKSNMERHEVTHSKEKPFECDLCDAAFRSAYSQRMHRLTHQDAKRYLCDFCGNAFSQKSTLKSHVGIAHTGEKPFACTVCNERFADRMRLRNHRKGHSQEERINARRRLENIRIVDDS